VFASLGLKDSLGAKAAYDAYPAGIPKSALLTGIVELDSGDRAMAIEHLRSVPPGLLLRVLSSLVLQWATLGGRTAQRIGSTKRHVQLCLAKSCSSWKSGWLEKENVRYPHIFKRCASAPDSTSDPSGRLAQDLDLRARHELVNRAPRDDVVEFGFLGVGKRAVELELHFQDVRALALARVVALDMHVDAIERYPVPFAYTCAVNALHAARDASK